MGQGRGRTMTTSSPRGVEQEPGLGASIPVSWARWGRWSAALSRIRPTSGPPVLVLSLPRSGSSWVGETLGFAPDALYLREPMSQGDPLFRRLGTVFAMDDRPDLVARHQVLADRAFAGCPAFPADIVRFPERWSWRDRPGRRVVVKEVNPLAGPWYAARYRPRLVFLVRHPVAVALSWARKGWLDERPESWAAQGRLQAETLGRAMAGLEGYRDAMRVVTYESLCTDPMAAFPDLYRFAGLSWNESVAAYVQGHTQQRHAGDVFGTSRPSRLMLAAWRNQATPEQVSAVRAGFRSVSLPWYRDDADWIPAASAA